MRAALCADAVTAEGARRWNDANVLALSLRSTSQARLGEILDGWFEGAPSDEHDDVANIRHVDEICFRPQVAQALRPQASARCQREPFSIRRSGGQHALMLEHLTPRDLGAMMTRRLILTLTNRSGNNPA